MPAVGLADARRSLHHAWRISGSRVEGWLYVAPAVILAGLLILYPFGYNLWLSLLNRSARRVGSFVGLDNYVRLLGDLGFYAAAGRTLAWTVGVVAGQVLLGLALALLLNRTFPGRGFIRASLLIPYALSTVTVVFVWKWLLNDINGIVSLTLMSVGLTDSPVVFLATPLSAMLTVMVVAIWQATPFTVLVILAGLQSVPAELYDAARVDGGGRWTEFRHVTLPQLRPVLTTIVLIKAIWTFNWFDLIWIYTGGGPADATRTLAVAVYDEGFRRFRFSEAATIGVMMLICVAFLALPLARHAERDA
jgi:ABC-type sugar transport system permease subunit